MSDEWGPWIEHDGKGCPCVGMVVHVVLKGVPDKITIAGEECLLRGCDPNSTLSAWVWADGKPGFSDIIRYRIRKPLGLTILENLIANLPQPSTPKVVQNVTV